MPNSKRYQMDAQWQKGFRELELADQAKERAELLEHALRDL